MNPGSKDAPTPAEALRRQLLSSARAALDVDIAPAVETHNALTSIVSAYGSIVRTLKGRIDQLERAVRELRQQLAEATAELPEQADAKGDPRAKGE